LHTGLRVSELAALKWKKVQVSERKGEMDIEGKGKKHRVVQLNKDARAALMMLGYDQHQGKDRHVVQSSKGPMTIRGIQYIVQYYGKRAGLKDLSVHSLRHTLAHDLLAARVEVHFVSDMLGHESTATTAHYLTPSKPELRAKVEMIATERDEPEDYEPSRPGR
jgi:site-specific recombinase XerD